MFKYRLSYKTSARPMATLTKPTLEAFLRARPDSVSLVLNRWSVRFKNLTGKTPRLCPDQTILLSEHSGAGANGSWNSAYSDLPFNLYLIQRCFVEGFLRDISIEDEKSLQVAEDFYEMMDSIRTKKPL